MRLKVAINWAGACGGCDVSILDLEEKILEVVEIADIVYWPVAMDFKREDLAALAPGSVDVGLFNGVIWALVVGGIAFLWFKEANIGIVIAAAMIINLVVAALSGAAIPLILRKMGIDPAIAGSVVVTTVTDIVGLFVFLGLATVFLL